MKDKKFIHLIPLGVTAIVLVRTWSILLNGEQGVMQKHVIALMTFLLVGTLFLFRFRVGIYAMGLWLLAASLGLMAVFPEIVSKAYFIRIGSMEISGPYIVWNAVLLLLLYLACSGRYLLLALRSRIIATRTGK